MVTSSGLMRIVTPCWKPAGGGGREGGGSSRRGSGGGSVTLGRVDGLTWYKDLGQHVNGEFSMAVVQANALLEDQSQLESGPLGNGACPPHGTFVGVYDGHGGPEAARFVADSLFGHLKKLTSDELGVSTDVISKSFSTTEEDFLSLVRKSWQTRPQLAAVGACCLVGIICGGMLYIANAGDSRAVLATTRKGSRDVTALQMSEEHNASIESVREELRLQHPEDPNIVVLKHNVWRVKGIIQISRSIGDAYLKNAEFNKEPLLPKFRLPKPFPKPILSAEPSVITHKLSPEDQFLIFASDGLWEHLSNQQAVGIVANSPRNGIARRLIKAALQEAAKKREMRYSDLIKIDRGVRRHFHDDITVVVVFLDSAPRSSYLRGQTVSLRAAGFPL